MRIPYRCYLLGGLLPLLAGAAPPLWAHAAAGYRVPSGWLAAQATIAMAITNVPSGGQVVSDTTVVYSRPTPLMHKNDPLHLGASWTGFRNGLYLVSLGRTASGLRLGTPRQLLTGPLGDIVSPDAIGGGWLVYSQYADQDPAGPWVLVARQLSGGRQVTLDSPALEGGPSLAPQASGDGRTVVWQSWTYASGRAVSAIRAYDLATGRRRLLASGGSTTTWSYDWPGISGGRVVFEKEQLARVSQPTCQILLVDQATGRLQALTPADQANSEPSISGDLVTWKQGARFANGASVGAYNLRTGTRRSIAGSNIEQPHASAGRYVIYPSGAPSSTRLYDDRTGASRTLATNTGNIVLGGENTVAYNTYSPGELQFHVLALRP